MMCAAICVGSMLRSVVPSLFAYGLPAGRVLALGGFYRPWGIRRDTGKSRY